MALNKLYTQNDKTKNLNQLPNLTDGGGTSTIRTPSLDPSQSITGTGQINGITMTNTATPSTNNGGQASDNSLDSAYSTGGSVQSQNSPIDDELAKLAREGNYKAYLNKTIQNANVSRLAQKYLENSLKQQGIETQGAGTIAGTQLANAYLNANAQAQSDFYDTERSITSEANTRVDSANKENLNEWSQLLATASQNGNLDEAYQQILDNNPDMDEATKNKLSQYYAAYDNKTSESSSKVSTYQNYMSAAANSGNLDTWYQENVLNNADLSDSEKQELARYYSAIKSSTNSENWLSNNADHVSGQYTADELTNRDLGNGKTGSDIEWELNAMTDYITSNKPNQPVMFQLTSDRNGVTSYVYYDPTSGGYYYVDKNTADSFNGTKMSANKHDISNGFSKEKSDMTTNERIAYENNSLGVGYTNTVGFPQNPKKNDTYEWGGYVWQYDGNYRWTRVSKSNP